MFPWFTPCSRPDDEPCNCCWTWDGFSLATDDEAMLLRRLSMWTILIARTMMSILRIFYHLNSNSVVLWIIWDVISGNRRRFDISLFALAIIQVIMLIFSLDKPSYDSMGMVWLFLPKIIASQPKEKEEAVVKS
ncbi:hypothetical protein Neosp_005456 [[Neocosmospora] mangrovei]